MDLKGKLAIVTGVSKGIGKATAEALLANDVSVAGWGRNPPDLDHDRFEFFEVDIRSAHSVQKAFDKTTDKLGKDVSILVNNAGVGYEGPLENLDHEHWHSMFETNVDGTFYCSQLVIPQMKINDEGHIINIASIAGTTGIQNMAAYAATKHAVRGLSHSLYKEVRNNGIKVTCIYPGSVNTGFFDDIDSVTANDNMMRPSDIADTIVHCLKSHPNYHHVDIEVRPLKPKG